MDCFKNTPFLLFVEFMILLFKTRKYRVLQIEHMQSELARTIEKCPVVVSLGVENPPKSPNSFKLVSRKKRCKIVVSEPRVVAAISIAERVCQDR